MTSPKEAQIKEQYDNTEPSGKAEQDAIKEAPDWLDEVQESIKPKRLDRRGLSEEEFKRAVWYNQAIDDMTAKTPEAKAAIAQHIAEQVEAAIIQGVEMCHNELFVNAKSVNGVIELDTGETAIRYNNLLAKLRREA